MARTGHRGGRGRLAPSSAKPLATPKSAAGASIPQAARVAAPLGSAQPRRSLSLLALFRTVDDRHRSKASLQKAPGRRTAAAPAQGGGGVQCPRSLEATRSAKPVKRV